ncbi:VWA domain-containing protein [Acaryochloris marina]|uniref:VWA domain-containing protein n=1 Tax=Acaryochloris marina TaxID=155978 RepID=UPI001BAFCD7F|nr:VWA domain-containing protein [Acaryochloris marina]QUY41802.1 VWA domain-containing protein [Acaryochloris marina S15]
MVKLSPHRTLLRCQAALLVALSTACAGGPNSTTSPSSNNQGMEVTFLVGSAMGEFCQQSMKRFNQTGPTLKDGSSFYVKCVAKGSGDVVSALLTQADSLKNGSVSAEDPSWPTLVSLDGDIYVDQLAYQFNQLFPGQNYLPTVADAPLLANSPMVFMVREDLAQSLRKTKDPFQALLTAKSHKDLDAGSQPLPLRYVHTAPTRSNSGLQTLVAQFASVSGKRPEQLTVADVTAHQGKVGEIQKKITRYGTSTTSLAKAMVTNGPFWASVGSVYESSVIAANAQVPAGQPRYQAVYPGNTYTSNMRGILATGPWISSAEKEAAEQVIQYLRQPDTQQIATTLGLRPGTPGVSLGNKFTKNWGVETQPKYDSYRVPKPEVVEAMIQSWQTAAKKPSQVVIVVDSSGSMTGAKLAAVQSTLQTYLKGLGPKEKVSLIDFDSVVRKPVSVDGTPEGQSKGIEFVVALKADGNTKLYDSILAAQTWLTQNLRSDAINAVIVLTDGEDSGSSQQLSQLLAGLKKSGFEGKQRIAIFTVGYGNSGDFAPDVLKQIAEANGGYYRQGDPASIASLMADLQVEF